MIHIFVFMIRGVEGLVVSRCVWKLWKYGRISEYIIENVPQIERMP